MTHSALYMLEEYGGMDLGTDSDIDGTPGSFAAQFVEEVLAKAGYNPIQPNTQRSQEARGKDPVILGAQIGEASCKAQLRGGKTSAAARGTSPIVSIAQYMGFSVNQLAGGAAKVTGGSATTLVCADGDDPGWAIGDHVLCACKAAAQLQQRCISRIVSNAGDTTITVFPNFDATNYPTNGDTFYAMDTLHPDPGKASTYFGLDLYKGAGSTDRGKIRALGCGGTMKIDESAVGEIPYATLAFMIDNWARSAANRADAEDGFAKGAAFMSDAFYFDSVAVAIASFSFDPGMELKAITGTGGAQGRIGWLHGDPDPKLVIKALHDAQYWTDMAAETQRTAFIQSTVDNMQSWAIAIPSVQIIETGYDDYPDGLVGAGLNLEIKNPGQNADDADYPLFTIGFTGAAT